MKKKYGFLIIAILLLSLFLPNAASADEKRYIVDDSFHIVKEDLAKLNDRAREISQKYNLNVAFLLLGEHLLRSPRASSDGYSATFSREALKDYVEKRYIEFLGADSTGIMMAYLHGEYRVKPQWIVISHGIKDMANDVTKLLREEYEEDYVGDSRSKIHRGNWTRAQRIMGCLDAVEKHLNSNIGKKWLTSGGGGGRRPRYYDDLESLIRRGWYTQSKPLLTPQQTSDLNAKLDSISERHKFDVVVAVVHDPNNKSKASLYAAEYYKKNEFGFIRGDDLDGIVLLLMAKEKDYAFVTSGNGLTAFTDAGRKYLEGRFLPHLQKDRYYEAFAAFADSVDDFLIKANEGEPFTHDNIPGPREPLLDIIFRYVLIVAASLYLGDFLLKLIIGKIRRRRT